MSPVFAFSNREFTGLHREVEARLFECGDAVAAKVGVTVFLESDDSDTFLQAVVYSFDLSAETPELVMYFEVVDHIHRVRTDDIGIIMRPFPGAVPAEVSDRRGTVAEFYSFFPCGVIERLVAEVEVRFCLTAKIFRKIVGAQRCALERLKRRKNRLNGYFPSRSFPLRR